MNLRPLFKALLVGCTLVILSSAIIFAESVVKLSTYYPAPFGAYDRLKLVPRDTLTAVPHCDDEKDLGTMFYDNGEGELIEGVHICQRISKEDLAWVPMGKRYF